MVDLTNATFISAAGVQVLLDAHRQAGTDPKAFQLIGVHSPIERVLHICGLDTVMTIEGPGTS